METRTLIAVCVAAFMVTFASELHRDGPDTKPSQSVADIAESSQRARSAGLADAHDWLADRIEAGEIETAADLESQTVEQIDKALDEANAAMAKSTIENVPSEGTIDDPDAVAKWHREVAKGMRRAAE